MSGVGQRETLRGQEVSGLSRPSCLSRQKAPLVSRAPHAPHATLVEKGATRRFRLLAGPNGSGKTTLKRRLEHLSRAFFFDNSERTMRYLASWNPEDGLACVDGVALPSWFERLRPSFGAEANRLPRGTAFETSAEAASREAVNEAFAAGLPITVLQNGRVVRVKGGAL